jgi:hypothetical protein
VEAAVESSQKEHARNTERYCHLFFFLETWLKVRLSNRRKEDGEEKEGGWRRVRTVDF